MRQRRHWVDCRVEIRKLAYLLLHDPTRQLQSVKPGCLQVTKIMEKLCIFKKGHESYGKVTFCVISRSHVEVMFLFLLIKVMVF